MIVDGVRYAPRQIHRFDGRPLYTRTAKNGKALIAYTRLADFTPHTQKIGHSQEDAASLLDRCLNHTDLVVRAGTAQVLAAKPGSARFTERCSEGLATLFYRSAVHALACRMLGLRHLPTATSDPQLTAVARILMRGSTRLAGWAYGGIYRDSHERTAALPGWLEHYNYRRPPAASATSPRPAAYSN